MCGGDGSSKEVVTTTDVKHEKRSLAVSLLAPFRGLIYGMNWLDGQVVDLHAALNITSIIGPPQFNLISGKTGVRCSIGLVMVSSTSSSNILFGVIQDLITLINCPKLYEKKWGHTALFVRIDGVITFSVGFGANGLTIFSQGKVRGGRPHSGRIYDNMYMFDLPTAQTVEFEVEKIVAQKAIKELGEILRRFEKGEKLITQYTTAPEQLIERDVQVTELFQDQKGFKNCLLWSVQHLERLLGANLVVKNSPRSMVNNLRVVDIGPTNDPRAIKYKSSSRQGRLVREILYLSADKQQMAIVQDEREELQIDEEAVVGEAVVRGYPRTLRLIRLLSHVMVIAGTFYFGRDALRGVTRESIMSNHSTRTLRLVGAFGGYQLLRLANDLRTLQFKRFIHRVGLWTFPLLMFLNPEKKKKLLLVSLATMATPSLIEGLARGVRWLFGGKEKNKLLK